jgi:hypothetical protein
MRSNRKIVVLTSLIAMLTLASAILLLLAPPPLAAEGFSSLSAADRPFLDQVFKTAAPVKPEQWKFIYIHHSATAGGNAGTLTRPGTGLCDHFVIGNGDGCPDGEIQIGQRWNNQLPPAASPGLDSIQPTCISICVVGDFDHSMPTPVQVRRLSQLVTTLQTQFRLGADKVILLNDTVSPSGIGRYFPVTAFRDQILP